MTSQWEQPVTAAVTEPLTRCTAWRSYRLGSVSPADHRLGSRMENHNTNAKCFSILEPTFGYNNSAGIWSQIVRPTHGWRMP